MYAYRKIPYRSLWIVCWPLGLGKSAMTPPTQIANMLTPHTSRSINHDTSTNAILLRCS